MPADAARAAFGRCCGAPAWVDAMVARRPFQDRDQLMRAADEAWWALSRAARLEAFAHHPRIGDGRALRERFASTAAWAAGEQAGAAGAPAEILDRLVAANQLYERRFGYIFVVCATGKSAEEMLAALEGRLGNEPGPEFEIACAEQAQITRLRLDKLLSEDP
jgi:2-oxo-4-hydroxy-4-carboxy-5-ureidoimidazoline decarboxylase